LIILYFHPHTEGIQRLRQCLSYFFPSFSRSSFFHQEQISNVFYKAIAALIELQSEIGGTMITLVKIAAQLVDWTNIKNLTNSNSASRNLHSKLVGEGLEQSVHESGNLLYNSSKLS
jgi:condensin complex subunit 3